MYNQNISAKSRLLGIIGDPIEHSMSPVIQNAALRDAGTDYIYLAFRVKREALEQAIIGMRALNIAGLNVTIPHKVAVIQLLDRLDHLAEMIGSVNTIVNDGGILTGYNTDATGFLKPLLKRRIELKGRKAIILGAGGAARAISFVLVDRGVSLTIINRTLDKAIDCARQVNNTLHSDVAALALNPENLKRAIGQADILINATSIGMSPDVNETPLKKDWLRPGLIVYDIVYNPMETKLLKEARGAGAMAISGTDMLIWQGALAFEKWTGMQAPVDLMKRELEKVLLKHEN